MHMMTVVEKNNKMVMRMMMNLLVLLLPVLVVVIVTAGMKLFTASTTNRSYVLSVDAFSYDFPARQQQHQKQHQHHRSPSSFVLRINTKDMNNAVHFSSSSSMLSLSSSFNDDNNEENKSIRNNSMDSTTTTYSRRQAFQRSSAATAAAVASAAGIVAGRGGIGSMMVPVAAANAATTTTSKNDSKQLNLSNDDIMKIIQKDMTENQFLVNGQLTRSIYDESSTFQDEIDTYQLDKWIDGTSKLFDSSRSKVVLVDNSLQIMSNPGASSEGRNMMNGIEFRFVEYLCFNIPFVKPIVYLSGKLELKRNPETGLITSYQEKWDQNIYEVLSKKSKLFSSNISNQELDNELDLFYKMNANNISKK